MNTKEAVVEKLKNICKEKAITPHKMAMESGIPPSTVVNILKGKSGNPGVLTIAAICNGMGLTLADFFQDPLFRQVEDGDEI